MSTYIYIIYTPNLGLAIAVFDQEREQGRFRGSSEEAKGSSEGAKRRSERARGSSEKAAKEHEKAAREQKSAARKLRRTQQDRRGSDFSISLN